jgi:flavin reductase (DIM6/NTAB) family NADH-FMN oxidoreductase RutF
MGTTSRATPDCIGAALGRIPSGCSIITAKSASGRTGMLASWVQQCGFEPLMITTAVKKDRPIQTLIDESGAFVVNLLGEDPSAMFRHFGKGFSLDEDAFADLEVRDVDEGVVIEDQIAWLAVRVCGRHDGGDHWVFIAEVVDAGLDSVQPPYVHLRKTGLSY